MERVNLLVSDLDGTLLGDARALDEFRAWYWQHEDQLGLVYSSGRFLESICESIARHDLPEPAGIICGVGTEIHDLVAGERIADWPENANGWCGDTIHEVCSGLAELERQPEHLLSAHKVSYYGHDLDAAYLRTLQQQLAARGQSVTIVYSSSRDLDILPAATNKGTAAAFLAERWGIERECVIVAGDSGNDAEMFRRGFRGIVVANALPELRALAGPHIYHARRSHAAGVLEGLQFWLRDRPQTVAVTSDRSNLDRDAGRGMLG